MLDFRHIKITIHRKIIRHARLFLDRKSAFCASAAFAAASASASAAIRLNKKLSRAGLGCLIFHQIQISVLILHQADIFRRLI